MSTATSPWASAAARKKKEMHAMETMMKTAETVREIKQPAQSASPLEVQNHRLQALVTELLVDNQELRFKAAELEARLEKTERGLANATRWAGALF
jgi:predicted RNase H-like nuclease (RuvC/YqgF family)